MLTIDLNEPVNTMPQLPFAWTNETTPTRIGSHCLCETNFQLTARTTLERSVSKPLKLIFLLGLTLSATSCVSRYDRDAVFGLSSFVAVLLAGFSMIVLSLVLSVAAFLRRRYSKSLQIGSIYLRSNSSTLIEAFLAKKEKDVWKCALRVLLFPILVAAFISLQTGPSERSMFPESFPDPPASLTQNADQTKPGVAGMTGAKMYVEKKARSFGLSWFNEYGFGRGLLQLELAAIVWIALLQIDLALIRHRIRNGEFGFSAAEAMELIEFAKEAGSDRDGRGWKKLVPTHETEEEFSSDQVVPVPR